MDRDGPVAVGAKLHSGITDGLPIAKFVETMRQMRRIAPVLLVALIAATTAAGQTPKPRRCTAGVELRTNTSKLAYAAIVKGNQAVVYRRPGRIPFATFGNTNENGYPTVLGIVDAVIGSDCAAHWYRVQLPMRPNGTEGYVRAADLHMGSVTTRVQVDLSAHRLTLYRGDRPILTTTVAVGAPATPTPVGRFYVNQRLRTVDPNGPYGPYAIGVSAFSNVLTGWAQGGPIGIHGTNEPWAIGHSVSNGCIRVDNRVIPRLFALTPAGTPVIISP